MNQNPLIGHSQLYDQLIKSLRGEKRAHAYLFAGPDNVGKRTVAERLCVGLGVVERIVLDSQGDPDSAGRRDIVIEEVRNLRTALSTTALAGAGVRAVILDRVDDLTEPAANALLKILEEPPPQTLFFLIASSLDRVLGTICSRAAVVRFRLVPDSTLREHGFVDADVLAMAAGRPGVAISVHHDQKLRERFGVIAGLCAGQDASVSGRLLALSPVGKDDCDGVEAYLQRNIRIVGVGQYEHIRKLYETLIASREYIAGKVSPETAFDLIKLC